MITSHDTRLGRVSFQRDVAIVFEDTTEPKSHVRGDPMLLMTRTVRMDRSPSMIKGTLEKYNNLPWVLV